MDPQKFEGLVRKLSATLSRRSLVGGSVGASVLAAVGLGEEALGQEVDAEHRRKTHCYPTGRRCGYTKKKKDGTKDRRPCSRCCHHYSVEREDGKRECACIPTTADEEANQTPCKNDTQCCSGNCGNGVCQVFTCAELGQACNENVETNQIFCCGIPGTNFSFCNQTGTTAGTCARCLAPGATCNPQINGGFTCCGDFECVGADPTATTGTCVPLPQPEP